MKRCLLELETQSAHDINDHGSGLDFGSKIGYIFLPVLLLKLDFYLTLS